MVTRSTCQHVILKELQHPNSNYNDFSVGFGFAGHLDVAYFVKRNHTWPTFTFALNRDLDIFYLLYNLMVSQGKNF